MCTPSRNSFSQISWHKRASLIPCENSFRSMMRRSHVSSSQTHSKVACCRIEELREKYNHSLFVEIVEGPNGFPVVVLRHHNGTTALVHPHGGVVTSWVDKKQNEMLAAPLVAD